MRLVYLPTVAGKHLDTPVHTLLSTLHLAVAPAGRRHLLHRRQQPIRRPRPAAGRAGGHQRRRTGLRARQVGAVGAPLPAAHRARGAPARQRRHHRLAHRPGALPRMGARDHLHPLRLGARRRGRRRPGRRLSRGTRRSSGSALGLRAATSSSWGAWCRRTTRTCWSRPTSGCRPICGWWSSVTRRTRTPTRSVCGRPARTGSSSPATSSEPRTASCCATPPSSWCPRRSAARTRCSSRPWPPAPASSSTTTRPTWRHWATPA